MEILIQMKPHTFSCCVTRLRSQEEEFSRITLRMGCQFSEMSEPSVTEASTLTCLSLGLMATPRTYRDCFPTTLSGFKYKLRRHKQKNKHPIDGRVVLD